MRVRIFVLRLIAVAVTVCWTLTAGLVLLGYRPGGPVDFAVGMAATLPIFIAAAGVAWPPLTRSQRAYAGMAWLGLGSILLLVPSIADVSEQLVLRGSQTLLPSVEAAYPWALALLGTSLFAAFGIIRRLLGESAMRRTRLVRGTFVATMLAVAAGSTFTAVAMANELALRDQPTRSSRFGPTETQTDPPACDGPLSIGSTARVQARFDASLDGRPIGTIDLQGDRAGLDFRWLAYAATTRELGLHGAARIGPGSWVREPFGGWRRADAAEVDNGSLDRQTYLAALGPGTRDAAEVSGVDVVEGARSRHCRIAIDGAAFRDAFPQIAWLVGDADLARWRGRIEYWIFLDGELGQLTGSINGEAGGIRDGAVQATIRVSLTATERGEAVRLDPPTR
ncbi:MAG TPA: hypothetical protein VKB00_09635 [Candidatus Limnocylindrales bacterium]|nr:hypothetical protein [Candidatus Limnocylindrales bacterium]